MIGDYIQVFNRAPHSITIVKDGRHYAIPSGGPHPCRSDLIALGKDQNPIPGTGDPGSTICESLLSVVAAPGDSQIDSLDPIPAEVLAALPKERLNRHLLAPERQHGIEVARPDFPKGRVGVEQPSGGMLDPGKF